MSERARGFARARLADSTGVNERIFVFHDTNLRLSKSSLHTAVRLVTVTCMFASKNTFNSNFHSD